METELWSGDTKAVVTLDGAWVTNVSDENGDVFFPKRTLKNPKGESKVRGGCHVCLPNFGPGGASGLPQHGFGRELLWQKEALSANSARLTLSIDEGAYVGLGAVLAYEVEDHRFAAELTVENKGEHDFDVAPGFHPYFVLHGETVRINGEEYDLSQLSEAQFVTAKSISLQTDTRLIELQSSLGVWAIWTDRLGPYICVEPTQSGFSFSDPGLSPDTISPSGKKSYRFSVEWRLPDKTASA